MSYQLSPALQAAIFQHLAADNELATTAGGANL